MLLVFWFILGIVNTLSAREAGDMAIGVVMLVLCILTIIFSFWICCTLKKSIREGTLKGKATAWIITRSIFHGVYVLLWLILIIIIASFLGRFGSAADALLTILIAIFAIPLLISLYLLSLSIFVSFRINFLRAGEQSRSSPEEPEAFTPSTTRWVTTRPSPCTPRWLNTEISTS